jgi:hypothetical protein
MKVKMNPKVPMVLTVDDTANQKYHYRDNNENNSDRKKKENRKHEKKENQICKKNILDQHIKVNQGNPVIHQYTKKKNRASIQLGIFCVN